MSEKNIEVNDEFQLDIMHLVKTVFDNMLVIILTAAICGAAFFAYAYMFITPKYEATTTLYVNNSTFSVGSTSFSVSTSQLSAAQNLVDTYIMVLNSRPTLEQVISEAELNYSTDALKSMISCSELSGTAAIKVKVSCPSPTEAELIANTIAEVLPKRITDIVNGTSVNVVEYAIVPSKSAYPNYTTMTLKGAAAGAVLSVLAVLGISILKENMNSEINSADDIRQMYPNIPVFTVIPDMCHRSRSGYYGKYGYYGKGYYGGRYSSYYGSSYGGRSK